MTDEILALLERIVVVRQRAYSRALSLQGNEAAPTLDNAEIALLEAKLELAKYKQRPPSVGEPDDESYTPSDTAITDRYADNREQ